MSSQELEERYKELYDLVSELMDIITAAMKRIKKLEERWGTEEVLKEVEGGV